ncbi:MAG: CoA transferase [Rhodospirillales bacterium]|nr:CoA transferase [Rhodospirillales bacterium]
MQRPLEGLLVVALEQAVAGPLATCRLADAGARVIKIERADGDFARGYDRAANGESSYFAWLNRGKESLVLDIKDAEDSALLHKILSKADIFLENLATGAAVRAGLGPDVLLKRYPRLITCHISGYGEDGPYAGMKAYDLLVQAESGVVSVSGPPGPYGRVGVSIADIGTGVSAALAIHEALWRREKTGVGEAIKISLFDVLAEWMTVPLLHYDYLGQAPERVGLAHPSIAPYGGFDTKDGDTLLIAIQNDREWCAFAELILGDPELGKHKDFSTAYARSTNRTETDGIVSAAFKGKTRQELEIALGTAKIAYGKVNSVAELSTHPQLRRTTVELPEGSVSLPSPPAQTKEAHGYGVVPTLDSHGLEIRAEFGASPDG